MLFAWIRSGIDMVLGFVVERFGLFREVLSAQSGVELASPMAESTIVGAGLAFDGAGAIAFSALQHIRYTRTLPPADLPPGYRIAFAPRRAIVVAAMGGLLAVDLALPV